jgi:parallel beta-helix repeat protein
VNRPKALHPYAPRHRAGRNSAAHRLAALTLCVPLAATAGLGAVVPASAATTATRPADTAGGFAVGLASYAVPTGAIFVATTGSDTATGTAAKPVKTITRALALTPAGGTVVLRGGTYHETVTISSNRVTIQNYPKEAVWLDGSVPVTGWVQDGTSWRHDGWTPRFDASAGFSKGDRDGTSAGWQYVNPAYPMASHPDQFYIGGVQQRQVASRDKVVAGTFFLDEATSKVYLGTNPTGLSVRGTTLAKAISIRTTGTIIRGIGVHRYAPSIWHIGAVTVERPSVRIENVHIEDSATIGLGVIAADVLVNHTTILRAGLLGLHAATADRLRVMGSRLDGNNWERFNSAPVSGGMKAGRSRGILVKDSSISRNLGHGYWSDVSVYDTKLVKNNLVKNSATGIFLEISARGTIADNLVDGNGAEGVKINNTSSVVIWNNTIVRNARPINIVQDSRTKANTSYGDDTRYPNDPEMTWLVGPVTVRNNVIGLPNTKANCVLCVEDYTHTRTAAQMGVTSNGNVFNRVNAGDPDWLTVWSRGSINVNPAVYGTLSAYRTATGQDKVSLAYDGSVVVGSTGGLSSTVQGKAGTVAQPLPSSISSLVGRTVGTRRLGVWGR